jgi:hypothetical protein
MNVRWIPGVKFQEYPFNENRNIAEKFHLFPSKAPSTMDCSQPNLCVEWHIWIFRKIPQIEAEIQPRRYIVVQVKYPYVLTKGTLNYILSIECGLMRILKKIPQKET